jgi:hypothetical protein
MYHGHVLKLNYTPSVPKECLGFGNPLSILDTYAPVTGIICFKMSKNIRTKFALVHVNILRAHAKFRGKMTFFVSCVKKIRKCLTKSLFLAWNSILFTHATENIGFCETTLRTHRTSRYMLDIFCRNFLTFSNAFKSHFKNTMSSIYRLNSI